MGNESLSLPLPSAPYRGIEPFRFIDQPIFSARTDEVRNLVQLITIYRGIFLYGESGAGKSSLINAGLIPALRKQGFAAERVRVQPIAGQELVVERIAMTDEGTPPFLPSRFAAPPDQDTPEPARGVLSVEECVRCAVKSPTAQRQDGIATSGAVPVLIFDQFEELITLFEEAADSREKFNQAREIQDCVVEMLLGLLGDPNLSIKLVLSFREDYLAKVSRRLAAAPQLGEQAFRLSFPPETELRKIIRGPFESASIPAGHFTRRLSEPAFNALESSFRELSDTGTINLTEVQIACLALWENEEEEKAFLKERDHREAVRRLFGNYLDRSLNRLKHKFQEPAITALTFLVTSSGTRNIVSEDDLLGNIVRDDQLAEPDAREVLEALSRTTRLVFRQTRGDSAFYEISSEFLIPWITEQRHARERRASSTWWRIRNLYDELKPCCFSLIVSLIGAIVFLGLDQGREVLRALAEPGANTGVTGTLRLSMFGVGLAIWSLVSWYSARVLLYFDFPKSYQPDPQRTGIWRRLHSWLPRNVPRILGVAPMAIVGWSFLRARGTYESDPPPQLLYFGLLALGGGLMLFVFFILRRRWIERHDPEGARQRYQQLSQLPRDSALVLVLATGFSLALCVTFIVDPVYFAGAIGTGAVLTFAAACWVFWGSALVYFGRSKRVPAITLIILLVLVSSFFNDNHDVRVLTRDEFSRPTLRQALLDWNSQITMKYPDRPVHPLFIVASEGGGIRAAYWTTTVLGTIQDADPSFADHVFAISGVSGGSLGAAVFDALVADATPHGEFAKRGQSVLGQDFLSPAIAAMFYPDLIQRFLPFRILFLDRGRWLERSWEKAWRNTMHTDRFAKSFLDLWRDRHQYVPSLFLNGTSVESGNCIIVSNILIASNLATDAMAKLLPISQHKEYRRPKIDMPLSTAAHMSARFSYVSPPGRFASDGTHVVEGGYFENSGAGTALNVLSQVNYELRRNAELSAIIPQIIIISNNPLGVASGSRDLAMTKQELENVAPSAAAEAAQREPGTFLEDALAPAYALLSTRDARGESAQKAIAQAQREFCEAIKAQLGIQATGPQCSYFFSLAPATVPLPLGWMLSNRAAEAMQREMFDSGLSAKAPVPTWNQTMLNEVIAALHSKTDQ